MKAYLHSVRIAPKKANIIAKMVRGLTVEDAQSQLRHTQKKAARIIEKLLNSAVANAEHNEKQQMRNLCIRELVVQQGSAYRRGVPMARGRVRPMKKFLSHISIVLGVLEEGGKSVEKKREKARKTSQGKENTVQSKPISS